jgi:HK97 gp10 family phage protein
MLDVKLKGFAELEKALNELPEKIERNIVRSALRQAAKVIEAEAKRQVPVRSGKLRDSIRVRFKLKNGRPMATVIAGGTKKGQPFYAHFVEFGAAAHVIKAKRGKALAIGGGTVERVEHPGARKHPFMRPALDVAAMAAVQAFGEQVKRRLTKEGINTPDVSFAGDKD